MDRSQFKGFIFALFMILMSNVQITLASTSYYTPTESLINMQNTTVDAGPGPIRDIGLCFCNLIQYVCEYACCCDTDCDAEQLQYFNQNNLCQTKSLKQKCIKNYLVGYINLKRGMEISYNDVQQLTCVKSDQQNDLNDFYQQQSLIPNDTISSYYQNISASLGVQFPQRGDQVLSTLTPYKGYVVQSQVNSKFVSFNVYQASFFGSCARIRSVKFLQQIPRSQCVIKYQMQTDCKVGGALDVGSYFSTSLMLQTQLNSTSTIPLSSIKYYLKSGMSYVTTTKSTVSLIKNGTSCQCNNVVNGIRYILTYDETTYKLTNAAAQVYLSSGLTRDCTLEGNAYLFTEVTYANSKGTFFDGNPGYRQSSKVYAGLQVGTSRAYSNQGFAISQGYDSQGTCLISAMALQDYLSQDPTLFNPLTYNYLSFGQGQQISCTQQWTQAQLASNCNQAYLDSLVLFRNIPFQNSTVYLARMAYADPKFQGDWTDVKALNLPDIISYNATTQICHLPVQQNLKIFFNDFGILTDAQQYIQDSYVGYSEFMDISLPPSAGVTDTVTINFSLMIKFYSQFAGDIENATPPIPSFIPQLPKDIFYPVWYESGAYRIVGCMIFLFACCE